MQARKSLYHRKEWKILAVTLTLILAISSFVHIARKWRSTQSGNSVLLINAEVAAEASSRSGGHLASRGSEKLSSTHIQCRMNTCFDYDACRNGFKVYVTPMRSKFKIKNVYMNIIKSIKNSEYITKDPNEACVFILAFDTIDRDKLSADFSKDISIAISQTHAWNKGKNFLIFNLFSGTWPDYAENIGFDFENAIVVKASFSEQKLRRGFDISFPLFKKDHPFISRTNNYNADLFPLKRKHQIGFKGKRYLLGIGSEVRDALHLLNNNKDIVLLTTCRHLKDWEKYQDARCSADNRNFDRFDYQQLLLNTTFCLIPRGRRLGSFRFSEALQVGCIPVVLSDGWVLPFSEVIDWSRAAIQISEKALLQMPTMLRSIKRDRILAMRQQGYFLYASYLSSVDQMVSTTLKIMQDRVEPHKARSYHMWNYPPGALSIHTQFSSKLSDFPFYHGLIGSKPQDKFTAVILAVTPVRLKSCRLFKLIEVIGQGQYVDQILVVWLAPTKIPKKSTWPITKVSLRVVYPGLKNMNSKFLDNNLLKTDAVFAFDEDVVITRDEVDFAFRTWLAFPDRLVGFTSHDHHWDVKSNSWIYSSKISNSFSMISFNAAVYHRYYNHLYMNHLPKAVRQLVSRVTNCEGIAMNFLISHVTGLAPIKVAQSKYFDPGEPYKEMEEPNKDRQSERRDLVGHFRQRQKCFNEFARIFGRVTLQRSCHKLDPLLYLDPISNYRKRYRNLEIVPLRANDKGTSERT